MSNKKPIKIFSSKVPCTDKQTNIRMKNETSFFNPPPPPLSPLPIFFNFRLLDVCHGTFISVEHPINLTLVFEHVDQDLDAYVRRCPPPGLSQDRIRVREGQKKKQNHDQSTSRIQPRQNQGKTGKKEKKSAKTESG